jgi:plasmid stabilization system protein ParE
MNIEFLDIAEVELDDAFTYYEEIYQGLGRRFILEVESTINRVQQNPMAWQKSGKHTHRCLRNRFPYSIIYQIRSNLILIVSVACNHQRPNYWVDRIES